jgi:cyclic pyranopterin phosphate synthase
MGPRDIIRDIILDQAPIDPEKLRAAVAHPAAGANLLFVGTTRAVTDGLETRSLDYEAFEPMARTMLSELRDEAVRRFGLTGCCIAHRLGRVNVGEASVAVATSAPHRCEAFAAAEWLMDEIKKAVPIWKRDEAADGTRTWSHPGGMPRAAAATLVDGFGRLHTDMRISVTDRCNLRCTYCMPIDARFRPREELLSFEEIARVVRVAARQGIRSLRLTGGEPLMRSELDVLVRQLAGIPGIDDLALTTNGLLLAEQADRLRRAGLQRINVSLDTLREEVFERIARRGGLDRVLGGLAAAKQAGFERIRINAVSIRGLTEEEIVPLAEFCRHEGFHLRFIEFMPLDGEAGWSDARVLSGADVRAVLEREVGPLVALPPDDPGQPATDYGWGEGAGRIGFIDPVSEPFCDRCDRLRLTADGQFRNCLFSTVEWDVRSLIRGEESADDIDAAIAAMLRECVSAKRAAHGIGSADFQRPQRAMYQIGG